MGERCLSRIVRRMGIHQMKPKEKRVVANCCEPYARMLDEDVCCGISPQSIDRPGHRSDALTIAKIEFVIQKAQRPQTRPHPLQSAIQSARPTGRAHVSGRRWHSFAVQKIPEQIESLLVPEMRRDVWICRNKGSRGITGTP